MQKEIQLIVSPAEACNEKKIKQLAASGLCVSENELRGVRITRKSIDARKREIKINLSILCFINEEPDKRIIEPIVFKNVHNKAHVIIVGSGPAGLFAALQLIELGLKPIILERGKKVEERTKDIHLIDKNIEFNTESNYCFGEGGAGTFSDGKLYTRSKKRGNHRKVLELLYQHGAREDLLFDAHPHIGSDLLPEVIANIRNTITEHGGEFYFNKKVTDLKITDNKIQGVVTSQGDVYDAENVILATGHSAKDIYYLLEKKQIAIEAKPFALGVRIEHPQLLIDQIQYKQRIRNEFLPPAIYSAVEQVRDRGVYSFCMCPGGQIVSSATENNELVVNGMSNEKRNSEFANAGLVVETRLEDIPGYGDNNPLAGLKFQSQLEQAAFKAAESKLKAPAQRVVDFTKSVFSSDLPDNSYRPGLVSSNMHEWLPPFISKRLREAILQFNKRMKGYLTNSAVIVGVESRSSSPVRIPRDRLSLEHIQIKGMYPAGEGAGHAGGIVSSAVDGQRCAQQIFEKV